MSPQNLISDACTCDRTFSVIIHIIHDHRWEWGRRDCFKHCQLRLWQFSFPNNTERCNASHHCTCFTYSYPIIKFSNRCYYQPYSYVSRYYAIIEEVGSKTKKRKRHEINPKVVKLSKLVKSHQTAAAKRLWIVFLESFDFHNICVNWSSSALHWVQIRLLYNHTAMISSPNKVLK